MAQLDPEGIPARLQEARKEAKLTQEQVADFLHVHKRTVENDEHGASAGLWQRLNAYGSLYGRPVEALLWGDNAELVDENSPLSGEMAALRTEVAEVRELLQALLDRSAPAQAS